MLLLWAGIVAGVGVIAYLVYLSVAAQTEMDDTPRAEMWMCDVHGPIPAQTLIDINVQGFEWTIGELPTKGPVKYCPLCFHDRMKKARDQYKA